MMTMGMAEMNNEDVAAFVLEDDDGDDQSSCQVSVCIIDNGSHDQDETFLSKNQRDSSNGEADNNNSGNTEDDSSSAPLIRIVNQMTKP